MEKNRIILRKFSLLSIGSIGIIIVLVGIFTWRSITRDEDFLSTLLFEKGGTVIHLIERMLSSRMPKTIDNPLQVLAEELVDGEEFSFIAIADTKGEILIHSDPSYIGMPIHSGNIKFFYKRLDIGKKAKWEQSNIQGQDTFLVYKEILPYLGNMPGPFTPPRKNERERERFFQEGHDRQVKRTFTINGQNYDSLYVFIGQDAAFHRITSERSRFALLLLSSGTLFIALALITLLQYAQRNRELHKRHLEAQVLADEMVEKIQNLEKDLRQKEKLAAIGDLVAGVAHEIRNPLSSIKGYATFFKQKFEKGSNEEKAAHIMIEEIARLNRAIDDLVGVNNSTDVRLEKADIKEICQKICFLLEQEAKQKNIDFDCLTANKELNTSYETLADSDRLTQAILNITLNAFEAFDSLQQEDKKVSLTLTKEKEEIIITIKDNGSGISESILSRIFDPYFTTKNQGTGLGLVMSKNIIDAHNGKLLVESSEEGTVFSIHIPLS